MGLVPCKLDVIPALRLLREGELLQELPQRGGGQVRNTLPVAEVLLLLLIGQLCLGWLVPKPIIFLLLLLLDVQLFFLNLLLLGFHSCIFTTLCLLSLFFLLFGFFQLLPPLLFGFLPQLLELTCSLAGCFLRFPFCIHLGLLLRQNAVPRLLLELLAWLAHDDKGRLLEVGAVVALKDLQALLLDQVGLDLHDHVVPWDQWCHRLDHTLDAAIFHARQVVGKAWLIVAGSVDNSRSWKATAGRPVLDFPVAELHVARVLCQVIIEPLEGALIRNTNGHQNLTAAALHRVLRLCHVSGCSTLEHAALERQRLQQIRPHVDLKRNIPIADVRKEGLVTHGFWNWLRLRDTYSVPENAHGVSQLAAGIEIQHHSHSLIPGEKLRFLLPQLSCSEPALGIEECSFLVVR
mmetsp:Transcript_104124/g.247817  ORF Transcript_104124/g.247817 Transcript_104124/m.247817 type:complete len:406 (+) Transcript_104124:470-1687(+)